MHLQRVIAVLVACAIGQVYAAPHFLMTVKRVAAPVVEDIKGQHAPLEKARFSLRDAFLSGRAAVPVLTMDQLESERNSIGKRDMSSTVAANINTLIAKKTIAGTPGYEAFANAIMAAGAKVKRGIDLVTRYIECTHDCIKAQQPEPKDVSLSEHTEAIKPREPVTNPAEECGGGYECIKKRSVGHGLHLPIIAECSGYTECIRKRMEQCGGYAECIKRAIDAECGGDRECAKRSIDAECGGDRECARKREVSVFKH